MIKLKPNTWYWIDTRHNAESDDIAVAAQEFPPPDKSRYYRHFRTDADGNIVRFERHGEEFKF